MTFRERRHPNKEIAHKLLLSERTVKSYVSRVLYEFNVPSRLKLVKQK